MHATRTEFMQLGQRPHDKMTMERNEKSRELEVSMSPPKGMMGTIVANEQDRLQWAHQLNNGGLNMMPSLPTSLGFGMALCLIQIHFSDFCICPHFVTISHNNVMPASL